MSPHEAMPVAIVGCGFVADLYMATLEAHPNLKVVAAVDIVPQRAERFSRFWRIPVFWHLEDLLAEGPPVDMVLNLTNPASHAEVSAMALRAGKHVYSEKPFTLRLEEAQTLATLAQDNGVRIAAAPCIHLGDAVQAMKRALDAGRIGRPILAYAEMDDDLVARSAFRNWRGASGAPWPYADEFEVGVTLEHVGYCLGALMALFGPVARVVSASGLLYPGKPIEPGAAEGPDYSLASLTFESGVQARVTCSNIAPRDHSLSIIGETAVMRLADCWRYRSPVTVRRTLRIRNRTILSPWSERLALARWGPTTPRRGAGAMDFARGPAELAAAIRSGRPSLMPVDFAIHVNEVSLAIHSAFDTHGPADYTTTTRFEPLPSLEAPIL